MAQVGEQAPDFRLQDQDENWVELWQLAQRAGYTSRITAANVRELRRRRLVVTRPCWYALSATEVSLAGPEGRR